MDNDTLKPIHLKEVFESKNPALARRIPGFVFGWLSRLIRLREINDFIEKHGHLRGVAFASAFMDHLHITIVAEGEENLPSPDGRTIFVSNHPLGGPDGIALISFLGQRYPNLKFPVNDILLNIKNLNGIFLPVNKHGRMSREAVNAIAAAYDSDNQVIMFPAGLCSRKIKGQVQDLEWQKNFVVEAVKHHRDVVPIHISGRNTNLFYNLANLRKHLGIKGNIEMLLLPRETFLKRDTTLTLTIGKPIPWQTFDNRKKPKDWAKEVRDNLYR